MIWGSSKYQVVKALTVHMEFQKPAYRAPGTPRLCKLLPYKHPNAIQLLHWRGNKKYSERVRKKIILEGQSRGPSTEAGIQACKLQIIQNENKSSRNCMSHHSSNVSQQQGRSQLLKAIKYSMAEHTVHPGPVTGQAATFKNKIFSSCQS